MYKSYLEIDDSITIKLDNDVIAKIIKDDFNSSVFGFKMGNLVLYSEDVYLSLILDIAKNTKFEHLSLSLDVEKSKLIHLATKAGFLLVDTQVTYRFDLKNIEAKPGHTSFQIRDAHIEDLPILKQIAHESFSLGRFYSDPNLDKVKVANYYEQWIENSVNGYAEKTIVTIINDTPVGFITLGKIKEENGQKVGRIVLNAVNQNNRGCGIYSNMLVESLLYFKNKTNIVLVGTQVNNYAVQKTWSKQGGYLINSRYIMHVSL